MPKLSTRQYAKILYGLTRDLSGKSLDRAVLEFFTMLKNNQMLKKVDEITEEFLRVAKQGEGIDKITITSAHKLPSSLAEDLAAKFSEHFELETKHDSELLGGLSLSKGNLIYDASLRRQLKELKESMLP